MKPYTLSEAQTLAQKFFSVTLPVTHEELKKQFRLAARRLHSDITGTKATEGLFVEMNSFYQALCDQNPEWAFSESDGHGRVILKTTDGTPLSELGLGLDPTKNGRDCKDCNHSGYTSEDVSGFINCDWCTGGWAYAQPCHRCSGSGTFRTPRGAVKGKCFGCNGSGFSRLPFPRRCGVCGGRGGKEVPTGTKRYHTCYHCKGTGEIEIFNPVIPKGRLM